jgi:hypothetical protein
VWTALLDYHGGGLIGTVLDTTKTVLWVFSQSATQRCAPGYSASRRADMQAVVEVDVGVRHHAGHA